MNSYRRGLRNGVLVNQKLFILEKVNFGQPPKCWSNLVKFGQTCCKLVLFGTGHYIYLFINNELAIYKIMAGWGTKHSRRDTLNLAFGETPRLS